MDVTESDILAAIEEALHSKPDDDDLPRCEPGAICTAILVYRYGVGTKQASKTLNQMRLDGKLQPDWVLYTDLWADSRKVKGYRWVEKLSY